MYTLKALPNDDWLSNFAEHRVTCFANSFNEHSIPQTAQKPIC
jgi:hypothetical protein